MKQCGIHHIRTSPYLPSSNGIAERAVQTFKSVYKKLEGNIQDCLTQFLARYRITPHCATEMSPAGLLMGRKLRTTMDLIHPDLSRKVTSKYHSNIESKKTFRMFKVCDKVFARNYHGTPTWVPAEVIQVTGPVSYKVKTSADTILRRHIDQLRVRYCEDITDQQWSLDNSIVPTTMQY